jgi:CRISPR-associated endonuclease/helicase Cas3
MLDFSECFKALTGNDPFDWQERLFKRFLADDFPAACDIPTGLGKTHVMTIWLVALGCCLKQPIRKLPLRLVYVVDRRVIVDQATEEAEKLQDIITAALGNEASPLHALVSVHK